MMLWSLEQKKGGLCLLAKEGEPGEGPAQLPGTALHSSGTYASLCSAKVLSVTSGSLEYHTVIPGCRQGVWGSERLREVTQLVNGRKMCTVH